MRATGDANWRLEKAGQFLRSAARAFLAEEWDTAVSRAYYAAFHAVIALLDAKAGLRWRTWGHAQVQHDFRANFSKRGFLFTKRHVEDLNSLYEGRLIADYEKSDFSRPVVADLLERVRRLNESIVEAIRNG